MNNDKFSPLTRSILIGGAAAGVLDAADAIVAFKLVLGFDPIPIYQFVASGLLGPSAFTSGASAWLGVAVHFLIAFSAAAVFSLAARRSPMLLRSAALSGPLFGVGVFVVMNYLVIPLSRIAPSPFSLALFLNGVIGHAALVGLPIALAARRYLEATPDGSASRYGTVGRGLTRAVHDP